MQSLTEQALVLILQWRDYGDANFSRVSLLYVRLLTATQKIPYEMGIGHGGILGRWSRRIDIEGGHYSFKKNNILKCKIVIYMLGTLCRSIAT